MHGRPRVKDKNLDPERVKAAEQKAALFGQILDKTLAICKHPPLNDSTKGLALSAKLLQLNPEIYTIWNYRRRTLQPIIDAGGDPAVAAITEELSLTEQALMKNPKSYSTWHYRRWLISSGFCSLEREMGLVESLLLADDRNFHGWGYRQYIARRMGLPLDRELEFSRQKIEQNFSNYSAWHYRTALLPLKYSSGGGGGGNSEEGEGVVVVEKEGTNSNSSAVVGRPTSASATIPWQVLDEEFEFVKQALYTEPEDQSGWFYHRWLIGCVIARYQEKQREHVEEGGEEGLLQQRVATILDTQIRMCRELLEVEPDAKWPLVTMLRLQELCSQIGAEGGSSARAVAESYAHVASLDAMRKGYYVDAAQGKAHVVPIPTSLPLPSASSTS